MRMGYVTISNRVVKDKMPVGYLYREEPDNENDSGWRVFSGDESQAYADDANNFRLYNASTLLAIDSSLVAVLDASYPASFERCSKTGKFVEIDD